MRYISGKIFLKYFVLLFVVLLLLFVLYIFIFLSIKVMGDHQKMYVGMGRPF